MRPRGAGHDRLSNARLAMGFAHRPDDTDEQKKAPDAPWLSRSPEGSGSVESLDARKARKRDCCSHCKPPSNSGAT
jgi:hypothetical protein